MTDGLSTGSTYSGGCCKEADAVEGKLNAGFEGAVLPPGLNLKVKGLDIVLN